MSFSSIKNRWPSPVVIRKHRWFGHHGQLQRLVGQNPGWWAVGKKGERVRCGSSDGGDLAFAQIGRGKWLSPILPSAVVYEFPFGVRLPDRRDRTLRCTVPSTLRATTAFSVGWDRGWWCSPGSVPAIWCKRCRNSEPATNKFLKMLPLWHLGDWRN